MRFLVIMALSVLFLNALEISLDPKESKKSELVSNTGQAYFGEKLFKGNFKQNGQFRYNPNYIVNVNDKVSVKMWGTHNYADDNLSVDKKGNIFIPEVGAIYLLGLSADRVQSAIEKSVKRVFNESVHVYANVKQYQPVSIFVSGAVANPGIYEGLSTDSILQFIDRSGGIIRGEGSYRNVEVLRDNSVIQTIDLYDFLITGNISGFQFRNSDVIVIKPVENFVSVVGDVQRPYFFEFLHSELSVREIMKYVLPKATINSVIVTTWRDRKEITNEYPLEESLDVSLQKGDKVKFLSNYYVKNIELTIEGEHDGTNFISVKKGTTLFDVLESVNYTSLSDIRNIRFYRKRIASMQKNLIDIKLKSLESKLMNREASSTEEAEINQVELVQVLNFIKRAKSVKQKGQVVLRRTNNLKKIILEEGDRIVVPKKDNVVVIQGEVAVPSALAYEADMSLGDYIDFCGGFTKEANKEGLLVIKANGRVLKSDNNLLSQKISIEPGDSILVLQEVRTKNMLLFKDLTQILYQVAIGAAVVLQL